MSVRKDPETVIIRQTDAPDIAVELAEYLEVLGSPIRLRILRLLMLEPMDVQLISHRLWKRFGKTSSRENTKKHVDKLLRIGLVMKQPGMRENRAVVNYVMVPGSVETALRTLSKVMKLDLRLELASEVAGVREQVSEAFAPSFAVARVLGGVDDGREFLLQEPEVRIGRVDPENMARYNPESDIVLSQDYAAVSRVWRPHARLVLEGGQWFVEHCEGRNETRLWDKVLRKNRKEKLKNGDMLHLAKGSKGCRLVISLPEGADRP